MKKLIIIQTVAPDYRALFFERIKDTLKDKFELYAGDVSFETTVKTQFKDKKELKNHFFINRKFLFYTGIWHLLFRNDIIVLELNPRIVSNWIFLISRRITGRKTVLWGHAWPRNGKKSKSDWLRNFMRSLSSKIIVYTNQQKEELQQKMPNKEILAAPNAVFKSKKMLTDVDGKQKNIIYVGRLTSSKKVFFLVEAFKNAIDTLSKDINLIIVGEGEEKKRLDQYLFLNNLEHRIKLLGHVSDYTKLKELYDSSFFSVSPGYVGLSIIQSFGFGVPMLISKDENHSPELEAVRDKKNALFFETDSIDNFTEVLNQIYNNKDYWMEQRKNIITFCKKEYSTEAMAQTFIDLIKNE